MPAATQQDAEAFLAKRPSLKEMRDAYPVEWEQVQAEIAQVVNTGDLDQLKRYVEKVSTQRGAGDVKKAMAVEALRKVCVSAATGVTKGKVRFNLFNGWLAQKLLFEGKGLRRKPVSLARFAVTWPFLTQKRFLMPLVEPKGIYCFYSDRLVTELAALIGDRTALEIGAGDGTLARFLVDAGVELVAVDDRSWQQSIDYPDAVRHMDARSALRTYRPAVVVCSFPPVGNTFEREVFKTRSVELYVVIASRNELAAGDWDAYRRQTAFTMEHDPSLSRAVLPPELQPAVYVFRRIGADPGAG